MKKITNRKIVTIFLGVTLLTQAVTSLIGGSLFLGPFGSNEITAENLVNISNSSNVAYISIFLQIVTAVVIIMLGVAMYRIAGHINKTLAITALSLYIFEALLLAVSQVFTFGLVEISHLFNTTSEASLLPLAKVMFACDEFSGRIAMIPFGIGAIMFYYLLLKAKTIPSWLALWGIITVPFILVNAPLIAFGVQVPLFLLIPYVPFEFITGIYILVRHEEIPYSLY